MLKWKVRVLVKYFQAFAEKKTFKHFPAFSLGGLCVNGIFCASRKLLSINLFYCRPAKKANEKLYAEENLVYLWKEV